MHRMNVKGGPKNHMVLDELFCYLFMYIYMHRFSDSMA